MLPITLKILKITSADFQISKMSPVTTDKQTF